MDTMVGRLQIGFPEKRTDWTSAPAVYNGHCLRIAAHPVMEDWEAGYMQTLARIACLNGGCVLEVGYGLGLSARAVQSHEIVRHYLIECHPQVIARCVQDLSPAMAANRLHVLSGFWQDVTPLFRDGSFDGILFDTYPLSAEEMHCNHFPFFAEAYRLLKPGGVFTYYSDESRTFSPKHLAALQAAGFDSSKIDGEVCPVSPPADCQYWRHDSLLAPILHK